MLIMQRHNYIVLHRPASNTLLRELTLRPCSLLADLKHLSIDVKHSHSTLLLLMLLLLLLAGLLLRLMRLPLLGLLRQLAVYLLRRLNGTQHTECHVTSATRNVQVLHACKGRQSLYQPASSNIMRCHTNVCSNCHNYTCPDFCCCKCSLCCHTAPLQAHSQHQ